MPPSWRCLTHIDELTRSVEKSKIRDDDAARRAFGFDAAADDEDMASDDDEISREELAKALGCTVEELDG